MKKNGLLIFVGDFYYNSGSTQTLIYYSKAAKDLGFRAAITGYISDDNVTKYLSIISLDEWPRDALIVYIFENVLYLDPDVNPGLLEKYLSKTKNKRRLIIDTDAIYSKHPESDLERRWKIVLEKIEAPILQPRIDSSVHDNKVKAFPFFVFPAYSHGRANKKKYDIVYVGNNWHREKEMKNFIQQLDSSKKIKSMAIYGENWKRSLSPPINFNLNLNGPVGPNKVVKTMSTGVFNPVLVSKKLLERKLYTPRMFETLAALTIPLFPDSFSYANRIYGCRIKKLVFNNNNLGEVITKAVKERRTLERYLNHLRKELFERFSSYRSLKRLVKIAYNY